MKNKEIADLLYEIADFLEMKEVEWKPRAYREAARNIETLGEDVEEVHERGELEEIDGVGENIAAKISEYLETGELEYYEELKKDLPVDIEALTAVEGLGPKRVKKLYQQLDIQSLDDLEEAAEQGRIAGIEDFGEKTQEKILDSIEVARRGQERTLLGEAFPIAQRLEEELGNSEKFNKVTVVGSFRRRRPTVGDIDILATADDREEAMQEFCNLSEVKKVVAKGETKSSVVISGGLQTDLRVVDEESYGAALQYFTGSKDHNVALRDRALDKDWKLNEYGLFERASDEKIAGEAEEMVYEKLGLKFIPPEMRENKGEIEVAAEGELPELIQYDELRGDLQMHTDYSDGETSIREMAEKADNIGHEYILVTDHGPSLSVAQGPDEEGLERQAEEIKEVNQEVDVEVLHGVEANIKGGELDIELGALEKLDLVVAALHNSVDNPTEQIVEVLETYPVDILAHPSNRKINKREQFDIDFERVVEAAAENKVALEINSQPARLDLPWELVKEYRDRVKYVVSTDAHRQSEMDYLHFGVSQARRGWCEKENVLNSRKLDEIMDYFGE